MAEQKISMYDPAANAFREVSIAVAKKFVASAKKVEAQLAKIAAEAKVAK